MQPKIKDPAAVKEYPWNWGDRFPGDTITTSTFAADPGLTVVDQGHTGLVATALIAGGTHGTDYKVTNHVVTAGGRTDEWTLVLLVRNQ